MTPRKILYVSETINAEMGSPAPRPVRRVAAIAVIDNPFAGRFVEDLSALFDIGMDLGEMLMPEAVALLDRPPVGYGKAAIVGVNGDVEHAAAVLHPKLGGGRRRGDHPVRNQGGRRRRSDRRAARQQGQHLVVR